MSSNEIVQIGDFEVYLVKSARAKHIFLKQNHKGQIVLTCPRFCPKMLAVSFAKTQIPWIKAHVQYAPHETVFELDTRINLLGQEYVIKQGRATELKEGILFVSGSPEFCHRRVCSYAQKVLLDYIQKQTAVLTKQLNVKMGRITLRNTSSRWGSCSSAHNLSFCWKIAFAPVEVVDYLVAHEVAHMVHMDHSAKFWALVDKLTDKRVFAENWLKKYGRRLQGIR